MYIHASIIYRLEMVKESFISTMSQVSPMHFPLMLKKLSAHPSHLSPLYPLLHEHMPFLSHDLEFDPSLEQRQSAYRSKVSILIQESQYTKCESMCTEMYGHAGHVHKIIELDGLILMI